MSLKIIGKIWDLKGKEEGVKTITDIPSGAVNQLIDRHSSG